MRTIDEVRCDRDVQRMILRSNRLYGVQRGHDRLPIESGEFSDLGRALASSTQGLEWRIAPAGRNRWMEKPGTQSGFDVPFPRVGRIPAR
jgi:hypothetical protein